MTIGEYLIEKLYCNGIRHIFGVPGDYVLGFYELLNQNKDKIQIINTCDEGGAGFAADAYARVGGLGAVCITYCVGGLKVINTTAQAYAEKSPVIVISGAPGIKEREKNPLLHHKVKDFDTQKKLFEQITIASTSLEDSQMAVKEIDRVFETVLKFKRPGYIEIPRDKLNININQYLFSKNDKIEIQNKSDQHSLIHVIQEIVIKINSAKKPVILVDVEVHRFRLQDKVIALSEKYNIPIATTILGKSVVGEDHPLFIGVYEGAIGKKDVQEYVESSDCLIMLGSFMTDVNLGMFTAQINQANSICCTSEKCNVGYHNYENIDFEEFIDWLINSNDIKRKENIVFLHNIKVNSLQITNNSISTKYTFECIDNFLYTHNLLVIADVGDALFGSTDLFIKNQTQFLSPAYYTSMGFGIPAGLGAQLNNKNLRSLIIVGDGAFQMTGMELSTIVRYKLNPIVIVLNNNGYGTERHIQDGPYNDILSWKYYRIPYILGGGLGFEIKTEKELYNALDESINNRKNDLCLLEVKLSPLDRSSALDRFAKKLAEKI